MTALFLLPPSLLTVLALVLVGVIVALVAWALQLMQAANDRQDFSLMLAGCMVCSAAVGLATVMVITVTTPARIDSGSLALLQASMVELSEIDGL
ncbi:MAG: hypothetical protein QM522_10285 [Chitinophagaceae bacterium]|nr:hypothetical protein [Chitinophagaceae bacterium]